MATRYQRHYRSFGERKSSHKIRNRFILTLLIAGFLLYALFSWILPALIGGLSIVNKFKQPTIQAKPISESTTIAPPVLNIPYEATNTALIKIKGYAQTNAKVEIYINDDLKTTTDTKEDSSFSSDNVPLMLGINRIYGKTVDDKGNKSLASKPIQLTYDNEQPKLDLSAPTDNQVIKGGDKKVTVSGQTDSSRNIVITINGTRSIVNGSGSFSQTIDINDGDNTITVIATDEAGNTTQVSKKVSYQAS